MKNIYKEDVKAPNSSSSEGKPTISHDYHLTRDTVKRMQLKDFKNENKRPLGMHLKEK